MSIVISAGSINLWASLLSVLLLVLLFLIISLLVFVLLVSTEVKVLLNSETKSKNLL